MLSCYTLCNIPIHPFFFHTTLSSHPPFLLPSPLPPSPFWLFSFGSYNARQNRYPSLHNLDIKHSNLRITTTTTTITQSPILSGKQTRSGKRGTNERIRYPSQRYHCYQPTSHLFVRSLTLCVCVCVCCISRSFFAPISPMVSTWEQTQQVVWSRRRG